MNKSSIPHTIAQEVFESARNAAEKGLSQFFTPTAFGQHLTKALPEYRMCITDLNCGNGALLHASANKTTHALIGADIDPCPLKHKPETNLSPNASGLSPTVATSKIAYDLTSLHPLLAELDWQADLFVLNPPWRLQWHRKNLAALADSTCYAVRQAFEGIEAAIPKGTIDSTIATLMIALDRCTYDGEGLLIANNNTLQRLIFNEGAPHAALADHIWGHIVIPGNPMTGIEDCKWKKLDEDEGNQFHTGVIYFARAHCGGPKRIEWKDYDPSTLESQPLPSRTYRLGGSVRGPHGGDDETYPRWQICKEKIAEIKGKKPATPFNLWLDDTGIIRTALSSFETHSKKLNKTEADRLFKLNGKAPMQLVLQRADREELLAIAERSGWRVMPRLIAATHEAIKQYHASRAPLYPLSGIQRLGYCDEQDWLLCNKDLLFESVSKDKADRRATATAQIAFRKGKRYPLRTQTIEVERSVTRPNATTGEMEQCIYSGHELGIFLHSNEWTDPVPGEDAPDPREGTREYSFLDAKLKNDKKTKINEARSATKGTELPAQKIDFTLQQMAEHFEIPAVPDVATVNPAGYKANLAKLDELEQILERLAA